MKVPYHAFHLDSSNEMLQVLYGGSGRKNLKQPKVSLHLAFQDDDKKISNDQDLKQSDPISSPQNQKGKN